MQEQREQEIIQSRVKEILSNGAAIATTSGYRKQVLGSYIGTYGESRGVGFADVIGIKNDTAEPEALQAYESDWPTASVETRPPLDKSDIFRSRQIEAIAKAKLEDMINTNRERDAQLKNKTCIGIDTAPLYFTIRKQDDGTVRYQGDALFKPTHYEIPIPEMMYEELRFVVENIRKNISEEVSDQYQSELALTSGIQVTTGIAIRVPNDTRGIQTESVSVFLYSHALARISQEKSSSIREEQITELTKRIMAAIQSDEKVAPEHISGGINFADPDVIEILELEQTLLDDQGMITNGPIEPGIFLGAPEQTIKRMIHDIAVETL